MDHEEGSVVIQLPTLFLLPEERVHVSRRMVRSAYV